MHLMTVCLLTRLKLLLDQLLNFDQCQITLHFFYVCSNFPTVSFLLIYCLQYLLFLNIKFFLPNQDVHHNQDTVYVCVCTVWQSKCVGAETRLHTVQYSLNATTFYFRYVTRTYICQKLQVQLKFLEELSVIKKKNVRVDAQLYTVEF